MPGHTHDAAGASGGPPAAVDPRTAADLRAPGDAKEDARWLRRALEHALGQLTAPAGVPVVLVALLILAGGLAVFIAVPGLYARLDARLAGVSAVVVADSSGHEALEVVTARATLYPLADGGRTLVVRGEVRNESDEPQAVTDAQLQLKDGHGFVVAQSRAPLGFAPRLLDIFRLTDDQGWQKLVQQTRAIGRAPLAPRASATFMLVVVQPPEDLSGLVPEISLP